MPKELIKIKLPVENLAEIIAEYSHFSVLSVGETLFDDIASGCDTLVIDKTEKIIYAE